MSKMRWLKQYRLELVLIGVAGLVSMLATMYFYAQGITLANGDAVAHLNMSRRVVDSLNPGFVQLGYVWLPVGHLLMLPLIWINSLYYSGMAGSVVSMLAFVGASLAMYKTAALLVNSRLAGLAAFVVFVTNPNVLYIQSTPLTEMLYVCTLTAAVYFLLLWFKKRRVWYLSVSAFFLLVGSLSRYDGWLISLGIFVLLVGFELLKGKKWAKAEAVSVIFGLMAFMGPVLWLVWNWVIFGNPIYFAVGKYSAKAQQLDLLEHGQLPSYHNFWNSLQHMFYAGQMVLGWGLLFVGAAGVVYIVVNAIRSKHYYKIFFCVLGLQVLYYIANVYAGNGVVFVPQLAPHKMFNIRYALTFVPLFAIAAGVLASRARVLALAVLVVIVGEYAWIAHAHAVIAVNESVYGYASLTSNADRIQAGKWLAAHYDGGLILGDTFVNDTTAFYSKVPLTRWIVTGTTDTYTAALRNPSAVVSWVLARNGDEISQAFSRQDLESDNFGIVYAEKGITIYKKGASIAEETTAPEPEVVAEPVVTAAPEPEVLTTHLVARGESLWDIAALYLGDGKRWTEIAEANNLENPNFIPIAGTLVIPR